MFGDWGCRGLVLGLRLGVSVGVVVVGIGGVGVKG